MRASRTLNQNELDGVVSSVRLALSGLKWIEGLGLLLMESLEEVSRVRDACRAGVQPVSWDVFMKEVEDRDEDLARLLKQCRVRRFEFGRCWLSCANNIGLNMLDFKRKALKDILEEKFGAKFILRINPE